MRWDKEKLTLSNSPSQDSIVEPVKVEELISEQPFFRDEATDISPYEPRQRSMPLSNSPSQDSLSVLCIHPRVQTPSNSLSKGSVSTPATVITDNREKSTTPYDCCSIKVAIVKAWAVVAQSEDFWKWNHVLTAILTLVDHYSDIIVAFLWIFSAQYDAVPLDISIVSFLFIFFTIAVPAYCFEQPFVRFGMLFGFGYIALLLERHIQNPVAELSSYYFKLRRDLTEARIDLKEGLRISKKDEMVGPDHVDIDTEYSREAVQNIIRTIQSFRKNDKKGDVVPGLENRLVLLERMANLFENIYDRDSKVILVHFNPVLVDRKEFELLKGTLESTLRILKTQMLILDKPNAFKLLESLFESLPQMMIQLYVILKYLSDDATWFSYFSLCISILSLTYGGASLLCPIGAEGWILAGAFCFFDLLFRCGGILYVFLCLPFDLARCGILLSYALLGFTLCMMLLPHTSPSSMSWIDRSLFQQENLSYAFLMTVLCAVSFNASFFFMASGMQSSYEDSKYFFCADYVLRIFLTGLSLTVGTVRTLQFLPLMIGVLVGAVLSILLLFVHVEFKNIKDPVQLRSAFAEDLIISFARFVTWFLRRMEEVISAALVWIAIWLINMINSFTFLIATSICTGSVAVTPIIMISIDETYRRAYMALAISSIVLILIAILYMLLEWFGFRRAALALMVLNILQFMFVCFIFWLTNLEQKNTVIILMLVAIPIVIFLLICVLHRIVWMYYPPKLKNKIKNNDKVTASSIAINHDDFDEIMWPIFTVIFPMHVPDPVIVSKEYNENQIICSVDELIPCYSNRPSSWSGCNAAAAYSISHAISEFLPRGKQLVGNSEISLSPWETASPKTKDTGYEPIVKNQKRKNSSRYSNFRDALPDLERFREFHNHERVQQADESVTGCEWFWVEMTWLLFYLMTFCIGLAIRTNFSKSITDEESKAFLKRKQMNQSDRHTSSKIVCTGVVCCLVWGGIFRLCLGLSTFSLYEAPVYVYFVGIIFVGSEESLACCAGGCKAYYAIFYRLILQLYDVHLRDADEEDLLHRLSPIKIPFITVVTLSISLIGVIVLDALGYNARDFSFSEYKEPEYPMYFLGSLFAITLGVHKFGKFVIQSAVTSQPNLLIAFGVRSRYYRHALNNEVDNYLKEKEKWDQKRRQTLLQKESDVDLRTPTFFNSTPKREATRPYAIPGSPSTTVWDQDDKYGHELIVLPKREATRPYAIPGSPSTTVWDQDDKYGHELILLPKREATRPYAIPDSPSITPV